MGGSWGRSSAARSIRLSAYPPTRPSPGHDPQADRDHRSARRSHRHRASDEAVRRILALAPVARVGPGQNGAARGRRRVRGMGGRHRDDDPQGAVGGPLPQGNRLTQRGSQAPAGAGLARAVGLQPSLLRRRGVRLGASPGLSQGPEASRLPRRRRHHRAGSAAVNPAPLGVFDSGIGGLTVARALFERLPRESVIYFGDTARVPYGPKSPETVRRYSAEILAYLLQRGVKAVVVACNTSTAQALEHLRTRSPVPVVGVIEPGSRAAVQATRSGRIGVIGTAGTIASGAYERAIKALRPDARVHAQPCPLFVPLVEEGWFEHPAAELIARDYLAPLQRAKVDVLVLGCTHYPLLKPLLARVMAGGPDVKLVDSAEETATAVSKELERLNLLANGGAHDHRFVVSDDEPHFRKVGALFLGAKLKQVEVVPL